MPGKVIPIIMDTSIPEQVDSAIVELKSYLKTKELKLQAVVCSAGITQFNDFEPDNMAKFRSLFSTNVEGHIQLVHGLISQLRQDEGRIVVISAPDTPLSNYVFKTSCNGALRGFTRSLRVDLAGQGISVSLIAPAGTRGGMVLNLPSMIESNRSAPGFTDEMKDIYELPKIYHNAKKGDVGFDPVWAIDAVDHAVTSRYPKTTYTTTPLGTLIYVMVWI